MTIGNLSRNRYWDKGNEQPVRQALCTCTFIDGHGMRLQVDRSIADRRAMEQLANITDIIVPGHDDHFLTGDATHDF